MMHLTFALGLILIVVLSFIVGALCFINKDKVSAYTLGLYHTAATMWALGYIIELTFPTFREKMFGAILAYTGLPLVPVLSFIVIIRILAPRVFQKRTQLAYLFIIPGISYLLLCTNQYHHLYYRNVHLVFVQGFQCLGFDMGAWYFIQMFYSYTMLLATAIGWMYYLVMSGKLFSIRAISIVSAIGLPWFANMVFIISGPGHIDNTVFAMIISGGLFYWGIGGDRKVNIIPAARDGIFEFMRDAVFVIDAQMRIVDMNYSAIRLIGHKKLLGKYIHEPRTQLPANIINLLIQPPGESEIYFNETTYMALISGLVNETGIEQGKIISLRDITIRKNTENELKNTEKILRESEKELIEQNASKDRLFSIIAHDLKSPFTGIIGLAELLVEEFNSMDREGQLKLLKDLKSLSENTLKLLENLLQWAGSRTGKIIFRPKLLDMKLLVSNTIIEFYHAAEQKRVKLMLLIYPDMSIYGDEEMVSSVLRNLISNAIKYSHEGGVITIGGEKTGEGTIISVADTGVGLTPEEESIIFAIDHIYSKRGTAGESGTGLGLILCKEFMEKHQGRIWVESAPGKGSTFYLLFPERDYYIVND